MKILILGEGATGGYFGGRLIESGADVTFLVREQRQRLLRENGLRIESPKGNSRLSVNSITSDQIKDDYDLVILSCKHYDLESSIEAIRPAASARTFVLPILNGIRHLDTLDKAFGANKILGGSVYIASTLGESGEIKHLNDNETFLFGPRSIEQREICEAFAKIAAKTNFENRLSSQIVLEMWEKYVFLCSLTAMTCLMRGSVGEIAATNAGAELAAEMLRECEATAAGEGAEIRKHIREQAHKQLTLKGSALTASMLRDLLSGSRTEGDAIVGEMYRRAIKHGVHAPMLAAAFTNLQVYECRKSK